MDVFSHALAGAATGSLFGHPIAGAFIAAAPDMVLSLKRRENPSILYNITHSILGISAATYIGFLFGVAPLVVACLISHIFLDLPTHGSKWAPPLFYPFWKVRVSMGEEWEWFNASWWVGFGITLLWSFECVSLSIIGFRF